jgi:hypothetical protein
VFLFSDQDDIAVRNNLEDYSGKLTVIVVPNTIGRALHLIVVATDEVYHQLTSWSCV